MRWDALFQGLIGAALGAIATLVVGWLTINSDRDELRRRLAELEKENLGCSAQLATAASELQRLGRTPCVELQTDHDRLADYLARLKAETEQLADEHARLLKSLDSDRARREQEVDTRRTAIRDLETQLDGLSSTARALEEQLTGARTASKLPVLRATEPMTLLVSGEYGNTCRISMDGEPAFEGGLDQVHGIRWCSESACAADLPNSYLDSPTQLAALPSGAHELAVECTAIMWAEFYGGSSLRYKTRAGPDASSFRYAFRSE